MIYSDKGFLPVSKEDMDYLGWDELDFLYIVGDAYVDHPSFGHAIISRVLTANGYRVGIVAQPDISTQKSITVMGTPRLAVLISAGNMDSMVNHYTTAKKRRSTDSYSPGGKMGLRPDRATISYSNLARRTFGKVPILIGGIEASLRRFSHYDYWQDSVRRSILDDSGADLLMYGMGENSVLEIARALENGADVSTLRSIRGTCYMSKDISHLKKYVEIPSFDEVKDDKYKYALAEKLSHEEQDPIRGKTVVQKHRDRYLVQVPPSYPLTQKQLDAVYELPYKRTYHPMYESMGKIPAIEEVKFSLNSVRGCFGACNFCALTFHQGRIIQARSNDSLLREADTLIADPDFRGYIHDVGGPTANFKHTACEKQKKAGTCRDRQCLFPTPCKNLNADHSEYLELLRALRKKDGVKKVFVRSGIRFDYLLEDENDEFFTELVKHHISGQLKVAPEHISQNVLKYMGKPKREVYDKFCDKFYKITKKLNKEQYLVPYLMSSHPGSTLSDAIELALYLKEHNLTPQQVQDFYPTPGTLSTCMFYTGIDPITLKPVYVAKSPEEKAMQRALLQYKNPSNYHLVLAALKKAGREDLIGFDKNCLIRPKYNTGGKQNGSTDFRRKSSISKNKGRVKTRGGASEKRRNKTGARSNNRGR